MYFIRPVTLVVPIFIMLFAGISSIAAEPELLPQNAFDYYRRAGDSLQNRERMLQFYTSKETPPGLDEKRAVVQENTQTLAILREGFAYPCRFPVITSFDEPMPYLRQFRNLARLLNLEAEVKAADGDWAGASESCLDIVYLGKDIQHGALLLGNLVGIACQAIGRKPAWEYLEHLTPEQARQAMTRLQAIDADSTPFTEVLQCEKAFFVVYLRRLRDDPEALRQLVEEDSEEAVPFPAEMVETISRQIIDDMLVEYSKHMDRRIAMAQKPFSAWKPLPVPKNDLADMILFDFRKSGFYILYNQAQSRLLLTSYALLACKAERGQYPKSLAELCPEYLNAVPLDPFSNNKPLRYKVTETGYLLYSIGPDARDNGGKAVTNKENANRVNDQSKGDIVAGVNNG